MTMLVLQLRDRVYPKYRRYARVADHMPPVSPKGLRRGPGYWKTGWHYDTWLAQSGPNRFKPLLLSWAGDFGSANETWVLEGALETLSMWYRHPDMLHALDVRPFCPSAAGRVLVDYETFLFLDAGWSPQFERTTGSRGGQTGPSRALRRLRHLFNWAIGQGYLESSPFRRGDIVVVHIPRDRERHRRLEAGEDERLLAHAADSDPWLYALIIVLLETGCRIGKILALTWANVKWRENVLLIEGDVAKNEEPRDVPMTALVRALLEMRRHAPDGSECPSWAFVFGDAVGERVQSAREPWEKLCTAVEITDLHVHDLRR